MNSDPYLPAPGAAYEYYQPENRGVSKPMILPTVENTADKLGI